MRAAMHARSVGTCFRNSARPLPGAVASGRSSIIQRAVAQASKKVDRQILSVGLNRELGDRRIRSVEKRREDTQGQARPAVVVGCGWQTFRLSLASSGMGQKHQPEPQTQDLAAISDGLHSDGCDMRSVLLGRLHECVLVERQLWRCLGIAMRRFWHRVGVLVADFHP